MSNNQSSYTSYTSTSYTTSSTSNGGGEPQTHSYSETANYDSRHGGNITREARGTGQETLRETREIPVQGQGQVGNGASSGADSSRRIEDVTDGEQAERDRLYEERMEDEYAKREGGA
ncbi:hypothetical protein OHC33_003689 [Knufia fluminis]|uniref:Uncharacterized protein n=2 Tax=Knufia TaxID=430999 RepID=A0AAN8IA08_9EURO|nr:hypothetical protein OHC33_003689 [Knufia fluminis]